MAHSSPVLMKPNYPSHRSDTILFNIFICLLFTASTFAQQCQPGTFRDGTSCSPCPIGTWQNGVDSSSCQPCPSGQTTLGRGGQNRDVCTVCPIDTYMSAAGCRPCPSGSNSRRGSTSISDCISCRPGTRLRDNRRGCEPCREGQFSTDVLNFFTARPGSSGCGVCPFNSISPRRSASADACEPVVCPPGMQHDGRGGCVECTAGFFKPDRSSDRCTACPSGTFTERGAVECTPCPPGFFNSQNFRDPCDRCIRGTTSRGVGSNVCRRRRGPCPIDAIETADGACVRCQPSERINLETGLCETCPPDTLAVAANATECTRGPPRMRVGFETFNCPPGRSRAANGRCVTCRPGTASIDGRECRQCGGDWVAVEIGATRCYECPDGLIASEDNTRCIPCPEGTALDIGASRMEGRFLEMPIDRCHNVQTGCPNGYSRSRFRSAPVCVPEICRPDSPANANCRMCETGYEPSGSISLCRRCTNRMVSDGLRCRSCPRGLAPDRPQAKCICGEGRGIRNGRCRPCPPGTFSTWDDDVCIPCPAGTFAARRLSSSCENCPIDMFSDRPGASRCEPCPGGTFTYGERETKCLEFIR